MSEARIVWGLLAPFIGAICVVIAYAVSKRLALSQLTLWLLYVAILGVASAVLLAESVLLVFTQGAAEMNWLGISLLASPLGSLGIVAANIALFCALIAAWSREDSK